MNQLITQRVHPGEDNTEYGNGAVPGQSLICDYFGLIEIVFPLLFIDPAIVEIPKGLVDKPIIEQSAGSPMYGTAVGLLQKGRILGLRRA